MCPILVFIGGGGACHQEKYKKWASLVVHITLLKKVDINRGLGNYRPVTCYASRVPRRVFRNSASRDTYH